LCKSRTQAEEFRLSTMKHQTSDLAFSLVTNATESSLKNLSNTSATKIVLFSTMQSLFPNLTKMMLSRTKKSMLPNITEDLLSHEIENVLSNRTTLLPSVMESSSENRHTLLLSTTESILSIETEKTLSNIRQHYEQSSIATLMINKSKDIVLNTTQIVMDTFSSNIIEKPIPKLILNKSLNSLLPNIESLEASSYLNSNIVLTIYGCILLGCVITVVIKCLLFYKICMNASTNIHNKMFSCVLRASMQFFSKQNSGKITNLR
jgi:hypothetical protein